MRIADDVTKLVGSTPLARVNKPTKGIGAQMGAKVELFNPCGSVKDRIGVRMIEATEKAEEILKTTYGTIVVRQLKIRQIPRHTGMLQMSGTRRRQMGGVPEGRQRSYMNDGRLV